ncbi:MAG TPA: 3-isopropylmalate dehydrogenase [Actinomycetota bacterium]|nr:3-isopropylmalate dehydrogenase [Actinomycetota bacterium]
MPHRIGIVAGDGIGPEVVGEGLRALGAAGVVIERVDLDLGAERYLRTGDVLPDDAVKAIRDCDAVLLGAVGDPRVPPGVLERGLLLRLRFDLDLYVNLRPVKLIEGIDTPLAGKGPADIDMLVVRENTEGLYTGAGGAHLVGTAGEVATQESINTRRGAERVIRYAFEQAGRRRRKVTMVHKTNVLTYAGALWTRAFEAVAADHPDIETDYVHVDAACLYFVTQPERFDVVVTENLFGDILTDLGAAIAGGMGVAASGNIDPERRGPSIFEPVHGSAPDIANQGRANPLACILSVALMLDHLGEAEAAGRIEAAVASAVRDGGVKGRSTRELGDAVVRLIAG